MSQQIVWNGQGPIYQGVYEPTNGTADEGFLTNIVPLPCAVKTFTTSLKVDTKSIKESCSGQRLDFAEIETGKSMSVKLELVSFSRRELAQSLYGVDVLKPAGTVTSELIRPSIAAGEFVFLRHAKASQIVITDSATTPATLVAGTDYVVTDADHGAIQIKNITGFTLPLKLAYKYAEYGNIAAFSQTALKTGLIFTGINSDGIKQRLCIPQMRLTPSGDFNWLSDDAAVLSFGGSVYYTPGLDSELFGEFMRVITLAA